MFGAAPGPENIRHSNTIVFVLAQRQTITDIRDNSSVIQTAQVGSQKVVLLQLYPSNPWNTKLLVS